MNMLHYNRRNSHAIWDHTVTFHPAEVIFPPLPEPIKDGTRFCNQEGCKAELSSWLGYILR